MTVENAILNESVLSLAEAAQAVPALDGKKPHISSLWRWCRRGVRGVRLEYTRLGRRILTSREAISRFTIKLADADLIPVERMTVAERPRGRTETQLKRDVDRARRNLHAGGA